MSEMRVMGIDPGLRLTGYACVCAASGNGAGNGGGNWGGGGRPSLEEAGVFRLNGRMSVADRLVELDTDIREAIDRFRPDVVAVEKLYAHYKHPTTAITMGHARGVILLAIRRGSASLVELASTEVKKSLTGNGHASKRQMQDAVQAQLRLASRPEPADVADAIAIALCAARRGLAAPIA